MKRIIIVIVVMVVGVIFTGCNQLVTESGEPAKVINTEEQTAAFEPDTTQEESKPAIEPEVSTQPTETYDTVIIKEGTVIAKNKVNIRVGPGTEYDIAGELNAGSKVTVKTEQGDWYEIENNGVTAYIKKDLLEVKEVENQVLKTEE